MSRNMTVKTFMKQFTKDEIVEVLSSMPEFKRVGYRICCALWEKKSNKLLKEMDRIAEEAKGCKTAMQIWQNSKEMEKIDMQLDKLNKEFEKMEW